MTAFRAKFLFAGLFVFFAATALAQDVAAGAAASAPVTAAPVTAAPVSAAQPSDGREASFLPPGSAPVSAVPATPITAIPAPSQAANQPAPVETAQLQGLDPESIGLIGESDGGLGASMWKGTPRALVERLLPALALPGPSPALNDLARRMLLTTANVPEGTPAAQQSLTSMRVDRLIALGDTADAWHLAIAAKPGQVDEITLRLAAENALADGEARDVCARLPSIIPDHTSGEWQKSLLVCQLLANDTKAAQLTLDVLRTQDVKDDVFYTLADRVIANNGKLLPHPLTPLKPLNLALLLLLKQPLPGELYARPDAALIPELLGASAREDNMRVALAERAAERGIIAPAQLADVYRAISFPPENLANGLNANDSGPRQHALLYQAAVQEKTPQRQLDDIAKLAAGTDAAALNGALGQLLAAMIANIQPGVESINYAPLALRILTAAGKGDAAIGWLKIVHDGAAGAPDAAMQVQALWPLMVLSGVESENGYGKNLGLWLTATLKDADRTKREQVGAFLLLFDAAGFAVPDDAWAQVADTPVSDKRVAAPPAVLIERLQAAGAAKKRGETVLLSELLANADPGPHAETPLLDTVTAVRALHQAGFATEAGALARETAVVLLAPPKP